METLILIGDKKAEMRLIAGIARKFGLKTRKLKIAEIEDIALLKAIKNGETGEYVDTIQVVKSLRKK
jgi:hypothetical protein